MSWCGVYTGDLVAADPVKRDVGVQERVGADSRVDRGVCEGDAGACPGDDGVFHQGRSSSSHRYESKSQDGAVP